MSNTVRRNKGKPMSKNWFKYTYKKGVVYETPEKEYEKKIAIYHSDKSKWAYSVSHWFRNNIEHGHRSRTRQEFSKFLKDTDYEVQIRNKPRLPWWD